MANKKVNQLTSKSSVNLTDLFLIADPTSGQAYKTTISDLGTAIGSGVSSVNTLVGAVVLDTDDIQELVSPTNKWFTDTRARAALSASSPLTYNSGTGAFGIQVATGSQNGYLSSADWTTFNSKQAALSGTGFVKISGTTISYDNSTYLTTSAAASTYLALAGGTMTGVLFGASATFTGDLTISSTNPRIYLTDTDNNPDYFISNTDGTFTVYDVTNSLSRFTIGTTGNATFRNAITGGGSITGESIYSNGIVSVGTSLTVGTTITATSSVTATRLILSGGTSPTGLYFGHTDKVVLANYTVGGGIDFETNGGNITMQLSSAGNLSTTGTIDANGSTISINSASYPKLRLNDTNSGGGIYYWQSIVGKLRLVDEVAGAERFSIASTTGAATFSSKIGVGGAVPNYSVTAYNSANGTTAAFGGTVYGVRIDNGGTFSSGRSTIYGVDSSFYGTYQPLSIESSSLALNAVTAGNVGIGTTSPTWMLEVNKDTSSGSLGQYPAVSVNNPNAAGYSAYYFFSGSTNKAGIEYSNSTNALSIYGNGAERMRITSGGNLLIGTTTNNGHKLQVAGTITQERNLGYSYSQTSTSGTTSIVDTYIDNNSFGQSAMYMISYGGNPNAGGSGAYKCNYVGYISVTTGYIGGNVKRLISYVPTAQFDASGIGSLSCSVFFFNGTTETTTINESSTSGYYIRIKITGYNSSYIGTEQYVYLTRLN